MKKGSLFVVALLLLPILSPGQQTPAPAPAAPATQSPASQPASTNVSLDDAIRGALEERARATGVIADARRPRRRMTVEQILAVGDEIAAMPLLDTRSPREIMDDINAL